MKQNGVAWDFLMQPLLCYIGLGTLVYSTRVSNQRSVPSQTLGVPGRSTGWTWRWKAQGNFIQMKYDEVIISLVNTEYIYTELNMMMQSPNLQNILVQDIDCRLGDNEELKLLTPPSLSGDPLCKTKKLMKWESATLNKHYTQTEIKPISHCGGRNAKTDSMNISENGEVICRSGVKEILSG